MFIDTPRPFVLLSTGPCCRLRLLAYLLACFTQGGILSFFKFNDKAKCSTTPPGLVLLVACCLFCLTSQHVARVDTQVELMVSRVHSVADFGSWGRGVSARGRLRGLEGDLSDF